MTLIYKDPTQPIEARLEDLMSRMTVEEKIGQMCQLDGRIEPETWITEKHVGSFLHIIGQRTNELQKVAEGMYFHADAVKAGKERLRDHLLAAGSMTAADARKILASTRKFCIPLLEQLDRDGFTIRKGDVRVLRET